MKDTKKGILHILIVIAAIALMAVVVFVGVGSHHKGKAENIKLGLDLAGGVSITYEANADNPTEEQMNDTVYKLQKRVENYSTEAAVYKEGAKRINVDIPGVTDANAILEALGKAGSIQFVEPDGTVVIDGSDINTASAQTNTQGATSYEVKLELNGSGKEKFAEATERLVGQQISIVYDGSVIQAPTVNTAITDGVAVISGQESFEAAEDLAATIRIGALPLELKEVRSNVVGAKLGSEAIRTSLIAGLIGFILVILFMIIYYRIPGVAASIALTAYVAMVAIVLNGFNVTLTLPGIAGIILSIGMAVDANVIIFTRIREELATGKTVRSAIKMGFDKAMSAIVDGNITTLIAAVVLYLKGSGTVKGFAQTLGIGIVLSMVTALFVTKFVLNAFYNMGLDKEKFYGVQKKTKTIPFTKHFPKFAIFSIVLIAIGVGALFVNKSQIGEILNYGLDFKGGTSTEVTFTGDLPSNDEMAKAVEDATGCKAEISEVKGANALLVKTTELDLSKREALQTALQETYQVEEKNIQTESISASVSDEMKSDAIIAVIIAGICMLIYIWIRFKDFNFGASAVLALLHDVLVVFMVYSVARIAVDSNFIACMLTIVGYSVNATIVIFDRIRENKKKINDRNLEALAEVVDNSITETISRSINTSLTTFIMVFLLAILGVSSIRDFTIPLMVGIVCGAYSSICITGALWFCLKKITTKEKTSAKKAK
ncbi:MAG: protein translocase subunit SecD [Clostridiales bacterium]|nr:protein translocase subunit SecD [Clostridiales bacterium]